MDSPHVYDKAKYHYDSIREHELSDEHAANHTVFFLRWLIEHDLMSQEFMEESVDILNKFRSGTAGIHQIYESWDCCLIDDMLSDEGNAFAMHYFDFEKGEYLQDYAAILQRDLPSEFHVDYSEANYERIQAVIERRYQEWKSQNSC
jgi:hypothetical protein